MYMNDELHPADDRPAPRATTDRQRVLVVDDDAAMRRLNTEVLLCYGYAVDTADSGESAWDALQLNRYDLMVTDNGMPKMTGVQLLQKLHDSGQELPTIMATGTSPDAEFAEFPWLRPAIVLLKPYGFEELVTAVKSVLLEVAHAHGQMAPPPNWQTRAH
jgi:DNA-binding response OmpR family regulator